MAIASTASHPTSRLTFLGSTGEVVGVPQEWTSSVLKIDVPVDSWESVHVHLQSRELQVFVQRLLGEVHVLVDWPRASAGNYELHLSAENVDERRTITIWPSRIDHSAYDQMLEDLDSHLPVSIALGLQKLGALGGVEILPAGFNTLSQELIRLRRAVVGISGRLGLVCILDQLVDKPHQVLNGVNLWVRRDRARRLSPANIPQSLALPGNIDSARLPRRVIDTRVEHSFDTYENRVLKSYVQQVDIRLRRLIRLLRARPRSDSPEAESLLQRLTRSRAQAQFLDEVNQPAHMPSRVTMVLLNNPLYRAMLDGFLEFRRITTVRLDDSRLEAPLENLPILYQAWGVLQVIWAVLSVAADLGYSVQSQDLVSPTPDGLYVHNLFSGQPVVVLKNNESQTVARVVTEAAYGRNTALKSVSFQQRPDVALEVCRAEQAPRVYLFDPKYKLDGEFISETSDEEAVSDLTQAEITMARGSLTNGGRNPRPMKVDVDKMHAYRDAIRDSSGSRVVEYAAILYPGPTERYALGLQALSAYPGRSDALHLDLQEIARAALSP